MGAEVANILFAGVSKTTAFLLFMLSIFRGSGGVEVKSSSSVVCITRRSLIGVSNNRGRIGEEGPMMSTAPGTAKWFREVAAAAAAGFLDMIGDEGRANASFIVCLSVKAALGGAATGVASTLFGVLAIWKASRSSRRSSRKPPLGAVDGIIELDEGIVAESVLGGGRFRLP